MRGVSAEALSTSIERVEELAESGDAQRLGSELFAVVGVLVREPALRRAMTDPAAAPSARAGLVDSVFSGKLSDPAVQAVTATAEARWSAVGDFVDAVEMLGVLAAAIAAEKDGRLGELEDELFRFSRVVSGDPALRDAISNKQIPVDKRRGLVSGLLEDKASASAVELAVQAVDSRHRSFQAALEAYQKVVADRQNRLVAVVRTAIELTDDEHSRLAEALRTMYDHEVHLNVVVDHDVLGGIRVELGDDVIDGTIAAKLDDARRRMTR